MVNALATAIIAALGFIGLVALRYARTRTRPNTLIAVLLAAELVVLGVLFLVLTTQLFANVPWIDVDLRSLAKEAVAFAIVAVLLGISFLIMRRLEVGGHQVIGAVLFGLVTALMVGILIIGIRGAQENDDRLTISNPFSSPPTPTLTPIPTTTTPMPTLVSPTPGSPHTPPNFKVAFIGDQALREGAGKVLKLIRDEGAHMVLHQGDFDYAADPDAWEALIGDILGESFPYFASVGNHDVIAWERPKGYRQKLLDRVSRIPQALCTGDYGVNGACTYQGLFFILSGAGTLGGGHAAFIKDQLALTDSTWSICSWHRVQSAMQIGGSSDQAGWDPYEECRKEGAIIATAHTHNYARTKTLTNIETQAVNPLWPEADLLGVYEGSTFVFVSGLGGKSIANQTRCFPATPPYGCKGEWARIYASQQQAAFGALFIQFHVDGDPYKARGYFKDINGNVIDTFTINANVPTVVPLQ